MARVTAFVGSAVDKEAADNLVTPAVPVSWESGRSKLDAWVSSLISDIPEEDLESWPQNR